MLPGARVLKAEPEDVAELIAVADVVIGDWSHRIRLTRDLIGLARKCRLIQQPTAGYENIDIDAASEAGIPVANAGPANAAAVAEHAILLTLGCLRNLGDALHDAEAGEWSQQAWIDRDIRELTGLQVGILGLGAIGSGIASRLRPFGCDILYNRRTPLGADAEDKLGVRYADLETLLRTSDVLIIALPLTAETRGLLSADRLALLARGAIVINVGRGDVMDYDALADALRSGKLGGAGLDVFPREPLPPDHSLAALPNVLLTPHIGGVTQQAKRALLANSLDNVNRVLQGEPPLHVVNQPVAVS